MPAGRGTAGRVHPTVARASKIDPELAEGELVRVARARNQSEAEMIQGLLLELGIPSILRRSLGFDVPDLLAAGPRDVMVPASGVEVARELLNVPAVSVSAFERPDQRPVTTPWRLLAGFLVALALGSLLIALIWLAVR